MSSQVASAAPSRGQSVFARRFVHGLTVLLPLVVLLVLWETLVRVMKVPAFILPPPSAVGERFAADLLSGYIVPHFITTASEVVYGFLLAGAIGIALGTAIALVPAVERIVYPYVLVLQTIPKVAVAPLLLIWFGFGMQSKVITAAVIAFFPILVNVIAGLKGVEPRRVLLMRALGANPVQIFLKLRLPSMLPYLFAGLEVATIFAVIGAVVAEFIGASVGLGSLIVQRQAAVDVAGVFSVLIYLSAIGIVFNLLLKLAGHHYAFWSRPARETSA